MNRRPSAPIGAGPAQRPGRRPSRGLIVLVCAGLAVVAAIAVLLSRGGSETGAHGQGAFGQGARMGPVELLASDLEAMRAFYVEGVGLTEIESTEPEPSSIDGAEQVVTLGAGGIELLRIVASDAPAAPATEAGLYHSAFLFPDEASLAAAVARTAAVVPAAFQGSSDHRVSQAFYFADPEGNGVELYADRPASAWQWEDGYVVMGSYALDPNAFLGRHLSADAPEAAPEGVTMGHVHLRGGSLDEAEAFYAGALGFAVTARADGALFFAVDGYHHHLAVNVWQSEGAGWRPESRGLGSVSIRVADAADLDALVERLADADVDHERSDDVVALADPWGTRIEVGLAAGVSGG